MKQNSRQVGNICLEILDVDLAQVEDTTFAALPRLAKGRTIFLPPEQFPVPYRP